MKKYWIIEEGRPVGPLTAEEIKVRRDFTAALPVWHSDLSDWTTVEQVPELACLLEVEENEVVEDEVKVEQEAPKAEHQPTFRQLFEQAQAQTGAQWIAVAPPEEINGVKRPKTFLGWNIAALLCCCMPAGVVGLIYGSNVTRHWMRGDVAKAQRASEIAEWCVIIGIVLGLVAWPFQLIFSAL